MLQLGADSYLRTGSGIDHGGVLNGRDIRQSMIVAGCTRDGVNWVGVMESWKLDDRMQIAMVRVVPLHAAKVLEHQSRVDGRILGSEGKLLSLQLGLQLGLLLGLQLLVMGIAASLASLLSLQACSSPSSILCE